MTTFDLSYPHQRATSAILQAERDLRQKNEAAIRDLRQVLLETAIRVDGERFESLRREDPSVPASWSATEWRRFFSEASLPGKGWGGVVQQDTPGQRELMQQLDGLKAGLALAEKELEAERSKPTIATAGSTAESHLQRTVFSAVQVSPATAMSVVDIAMLPSDATPPTSALINDVHKALQTFPKNLPASFSDALSGGGRTGGDLTRVFQRYWIALYLVGHWRLSAFMELEEILAGVVGVSAGSGSLRRAMEDMGKTNILISEIISLGAPRTALKLCRFSLDGEKLYQSLFGRRPYENEWSRLIRLHEAERFPDHTVAVVAFAMHARKRGYATQVLPESNSKTPPDVWVSRGDETLYVDVELGDKERVSKWRDLASLNKGKAALCVATPKNRAHLSASCKLDNIHGVATDLETLVKVKFKKIDDETPLWIESW